MKAYSIIAGICIVLLAAAFSGGQDVTPGDPSLLEASFGKLPLHFVENRGVFSDEVKYSIQGADKTLYFAKDGITFRLHGKDRGWVVKLEFVGANPDVVLRGEDRQQAVFSYFKGPRKDWKTGLRTYSRIVYEGLWPGIDLVYRGGVNRLKYEFSIAPGADPAKIRLRYRGAISVAVASGALRVETPGGSFEDAPPVAWQEVEGERVPVETAYRLDPQSAVGDAKFGFTIGQYDRTRPLVLDPVVLVYCGYIGGTGSDIGYDIAVDAAGNAYVTGETSSTEQTFPVKVGPDLTFNGNSDVFVAKVNAAGTALVYCGYIGGASSEHALGIAVDAAGNAYVTGRTKSDQQTFPVLVGPDLTYNGANNDAFVAKVNAQGTALVYCGYIGGSGVDSGYDIAVDAAGSAYVTGETTSDQMTFPVKVGPDLTYNGANNDAFVAKVNASGAGLDYCGYIGGAVDDAGRGIAVDGTMSAYVTGATNSDQQTFPVMVGPDLTHNGGTHPLNQDVFVAKVNPQGTGLIYCGYIGGVSIDQGIDIAVDGTGNAFVTGNTWSDQTTFPVTVGPDLTFGGGWDAFVAKVNTQGTGLVYCGYVGGARDEFGYGVAVGPAGNAYLTGLTRSDEQTFPVAVGPDLTYNGGPSSISGDAYVAKVNAGGTAFVYCGYIGGTGRTSDYGYSIAVDRRGDAYVTGRTESDQTTFPVKVGPDLVFGGNFCLDAFVAKVSMTGLLTAGGNPRPGGRVDLGLTTHEDVGLRYQLGSSLGPGPIHIGARQIDLSPDGLLAASVTGLLPSVFTGYSGVIDNTGKAKAAIHIPNLTALIGLRFYTAFVTLDSSAPYGIRTISRTVLISITK